MLRKYSTPTENKKIQVSFIKIETPKQTARRTKSALFDATLNRTFLKEKVGNLDIMRVEIMNTQQIIHTG